MPPPRDDDLPAAIERLLLAEHIDASYRVFVENHLRRPDATWRWCCGSNCDPCVEELGRVVDSTRARLGIVAEGAEGLPKPDGEA